MLEKVSNLVIFGYSRFAAVVLMLKKVMYVVFVYSWIHSLT